MNRLYSTVARFATPLTPVDGIASRSVKPCIQAVSVLADRLHHRLCNTATRSPKRLFVCSTAAVIAPAAALTSDQEVLLRLLTLALTAAVVLLIITNAAGAVWPTSPAARHWHPSTGWLPQALCIHRHESVDWHRAGVDWAGRPSPYFGGMQFLVSTWRSVGGSGLPSSWSPREQLYRAYLVWFRDGQSWREWGTAGVCGL